MRTLIYPLIVIAVLAGPTACGSDSGTKKADSVNTTVDKSTQDRQGGGVTSGSSDNIGEKPSDKGLKTVKSPYQLPIQSGGSSPKPDPTLAKCLGISDEASCTADSDCELEIATRYIYDPKNASQGCVKQPSSNNLCVNRGKKGEAISWIYSELADGTYEIIETANDYSDEDLSLTNYHHYKEFLEKGLSCR